MIAQPDIPLELDEDTLYEITYRTRLMNTPSGWYMDGGSSHVVGVDGFLVPKVLDIRKASEER